jgi:hypothetical protein
VYNNGLTHGRSGVRTWKASAEFDNFVVTGGEHTTIYRTSFDQARPSPSAHTGTARGNRQRARRQFSQRSLDPAREAIQETRGLADDQVVSAKITLDAYGTPANGQQSWYGLTVRNNGYGYYALAVLPNNQLQLRRVLRSGEPAGDDDAGPGHCDGFQWSARIPAGSHRRPAAELRGWKPGARKYRRASSQAEASAWPRLRRRPASMTSRLIQP